MNQVGFYYNMSLCIGCKACQVACKDKNNLEGIYFRRVLEYMPENGAPQISSYYSASCNHCQTPSCVAVCPTGAMQKQGDGAVIANGAMCIGCGSCVNSCPYRIPVFNRKSGVSCKCNSCIDLRASGQNPACVDACPVHCMEFGELTELRQKHGDEMLCSEISGMPSGESTQPSLLIHPRGREGIQ